MKSEPNHTSVCIFPDTVPGPEILFPLVQVFDQVVYLRPVENDEPDPTELSPLCSELMETGRIRFICPAPLGEHRGRFLRLTGDLQQQPDIYADQLSHLSLAGLGPGNSKETKQSIISTLLKQTGIADKQEEQRAMVLWQARLVLKLAEIVDKKQKEVLANLEKISNRELGLLEELREEDEHPFSLTESLTAGESRTDSQLRLRLKAWSRLLALGREQDLPAIFITTARDGFDLLLERYEVERKKQPHRILTLPLPGRGLGDGGPDGSTGFMDTAVDLIKTVRKRMDKAQPGAEQPLPEELSCRWTELLEQWYPAADCSRAQLSLYCLPDIAPAELFLKTFGRNQADLPSPSNETGSSKTIIGILERITEN